MQFSCLSCHSALDRSDDGYACAACARLFPFILGIPDFRLSPLEHFDRSRDLSVARALVEAEHDLDFEGLVHLYYKLLPESDPAIHDLHMAHLAGEEDQARVALDLIEERRPFAPGDALLEVGCGLGQYLAVAEERVDHVYGVDVSLALLVLARKRLVGRGAVLAAEAENLPFANAAFAALIAADVIEHLGDQRRSLEEMGRVLLPKGSLFLSTPNRFSLAPEPHVGLWGVGYLPRRWANRYVEWRRRIFYDDVRLLSASSLCRMLRRHFPGTARLLIPGLSSRQLEHFPPLKRRIARLYLAVRRLPVFRSVFYIFGPFFHVVAEKQ